MVAVGVSSAPLLEYLPLASGGQDLRLAELTGRLGQLRCTKGMEVM
jgi:hypothetical protein